MIYNRFIEVYYLKPQNNQQNRHIKLDMKDEKILKLNFQFFNKFDYEIFEQFLTELISRLEKIPEQKRY